MTALQIIGLCWVFFVVGMVVTLIIFYLIGTIIEIKEQREKIINYLKNNNNYNLPFMLVYKNLTRLEKREILEKVGNK